MTRVHFHDEGQNSILSAASVDAVPRIGEQVLGCRETGNEVTYWGRRVMCVSHEFHAKKPHLVIVTLGPEKVYYVRTVIEEADRG